MPAGNHQQRLFIFRCVGPTQTAFRIQRNVISFIRIDGFIKSRTAYRRAVRCDKRFRQGIVHLHRDPSGQIRISIQLCQRIIIFISPDMLGHLAIDSSIDRSHHVANNIRSHRFSFILFLCLFSQAKVIPSRLLYISVKLKESYRKAHSTASCIHGRRRHAVLPFKCGREMRRILKSDLRIDIRYALSALFHQLISDFQPFANQPFFRY